jgi:DNA-binding CsgD family transcriptional regulator
MKILVTEDGWLECRTELSKRGIELELRPRATYEKGIDGLLVPVSVWPIMPSRKYYAPVVLYGTSEEITDELRNDPAVTVLETNGWATYETAAAAVKLAFASKRLPFLSKHPSVTRSPAKSTIRTKDVEAMFDEAGLSPRQRETMRHGLEGLSREETAQRMGVSDPTVRAQRSLAFSKLRVKNVRELQAKLAK